MSDESKLGRPLSLAQTDDGSSDQLSFTPNQATPLSKIQKWQAVKHCRQARRLQTDLKKSQ